MKPRAWIKIAASPLPGPTSYEIIIAARERTPNQHSGSDHGSNGEQGACSCQGAPMLPELQREARGRGPRASGRGRRGALRASRGGGGGRAVGPLCHSGATALRPLCRDAGCDENPGFFTDALDRQKITHQDAARVHTRYTTTQLRRRTRSVVSEKRVAS
jgi:hypothetical protein